MLFSTTEFLFAFLPLTVVGFALIAGTISLRAGTAWLTAASLFFYGYWNASLLPLIILSIVVNFTCGKFLFANQSRALLVAGLGFNIGLLGYFKYAGFFVANVEALLGMEIVELNVVLPLAISFFTFQQIAYLVDVYRRQAIEPDFLNYCLFVSFFPQLISGPIVHHSEMMPQFRDSARQWLSRKLVPVAFAFIAIGLYKKVVLANGISPIADEVFLTAQTSIPQFWDAWTGALAYTFQIYFDFSGYTDMAIGIALLFGIRLPMNFNSPYKATNIIDFWRRWHMTLSRFIRDYIYIPLGGSRHGKSRRYVNLMLAMLIGGFWHGAGWTFIIWGGLHGLYLVVNHGWWRFGPSRRSGSLSKWTGRLLTFFAVVVAWVFFRAADVGDALNVLAGMAGQADSDLSGAGQGLAGGQVALMLAAMLAIVWFTPNSCEMFRSIKPVIIPKNEADIAGTDTDASSRWSAVLRLKAYALTPLIVVLGVVSLLIVIDRGAETQKFIYMIF
jgi:alginate O-acetyltransferase complex protein AlgI